MVENREYRHSTVSQTFTIIAAEPSESQNFHRFARLDMAGRSICVRDAIVEREVNEDG